MVLKEKKKMGRALHFPAVLAYKGKKGLVFKEVLV